LDLIKRMRDGKTVTLKVVVIWALKRLEALDWFREELRICREFAPPDTVTCQFFVTASVRQSKIGHSGRAPRPISTILHDKLDGFVAGVAEKRHSALIREEAQGDPDIERELRAEEEDAITSLPQQKYLQPAPVRREFANAPEVTSLARRDSLWKLEGRENSESEKVDDHATTRRYLSVDSPPQVTAQTRREFHFPPPSPRPDAPHFQYAPPSPRKNGYPPSPQRDEYSTSPDKMHFPPVQPPAPYFPPPPQAAHTRPTKSSDLPPLSIPVRAQAQAQAPAEAFDFGFAETPTELQKNLMRFAFLGKQRKEGWTTEYGRPDLAYMLKEMATGGEDGKGILGRRTCVFVCGPPGMRVNVANAVAALQADIWGDDSKDEILLYTENYAV